MTADWWLPWTGVAVFLVLWEGAPRLGWVDATFAPPFSAVLDAGWTLVREGTLGSHLLVSSWRGLVGLLAALALGVPAGVVLGRVFPAGAEVFDPLLRVLSQANPFALLPVFLLFFGVGERAKVAVIAWVSLWPILFYTLTGVKNADPLLVKTAASLALSPGQLLRKAVLPAAAPTLFVGVRLAANLVVFTLVAAEMLGASTGLGWLVHNAAMNYQVPRLYAGATLVVVLGYGVSRLLRALETSLFAWEETPVPQRLGRRPPATPWPWRRAALGLSLLCLTLLAAGSWEVRRLAALERSGETGGELQHPCREPAAAPATGSRE